MKKISVNGQIFEIEAVVFDKDGLLFDSSVFWRELAQARLNAALRYVNGKIVCDWLKLMDVSVEIDEDRKLCVKKVKPDGVTAVASPDEEIMITATFLMQCLECSWPEARETARAIFAEGDLCIDMAKAISPKPGFPQIFQRLRAARIPYGVATSDDLQRAQKSIDMYDDFNMLDFVITPKDVKRNKPAADMLNLVAEKYGVESKYLMMVGDSYVDVMMADTAGAVGVGIPEFAYMKEKMEPYATVIAETLDDIIILDK